ncbi:hypothetical protein Cantr_07049 [Candida viswanathii]|uniref:Uncharacterized protein n=1 Tax=Candida viswanathii TaxID=5486 RepID=A0A367Y0L2_9ASCO|nr:hypothetical protein Cantr_07049 [Candida viswanathii]
MNTPSTSKPETSMSAKSQMDIPSSPPTTAVEQILQQQRERAAVMKRPLHSSSPLKSESEYSLPYREGGRGRFNHHAIESPRSQNFNLRNKHNKIRQVRNQHRHDKLMLQRETMDSRQFLEDMLSQYEADCRDATGGVNIDRLIEDEREIEEDQEYLEYLEEAEQREWEEDAELIDMILSLEISLS